MSIILVISFPSNFFDWFHFYLSELFKIYKVSLFIIIVIMIIKSWLEFPEKVPNGSKVITLLLIIIVSIAFSISVFQNLELVFHDGGRYNIETSSLNCSANQWTAFYIIGTSVMKS